MSSSSSSSSIILLDATDTSLTVSWPSSIQPNAKRYILQYRNNDEEKKEFTTLSNKLTSTQARKRNLSSSTGFYFRVAAVVMDTNTTQEIKEDELEWISHEQPFQLLSLEQEERKMKAPIATPSGYQAALLTWDKFPEKEVKIKGYELQMRENKGGAPWNTISSCFNNTQVRKKNLMLEDGYQFRIRPVLFSDKKEEEENAHPFSAPSDAVIPLSKLSPGLAYFFRHLQSPATLLQNPGKKRISIQDALIGKEFVLLYISAHWCGPCRSYTPQLIQYYNRFAKTHIHNVEIVFCSADHDENGFVSYYNTMPWLAVDFEDDGREQIMSAIQVTGIPRLVVLEGKSGRVVEDNAVGQPLDVARWKRLAAAAAAAGMK